MSRWPLMTDAERFDRYVYPEPNSGCFLWAGATSKSGYGTLTVACSTSATRHAV